jgi:hypothetical protein
MDHMRLDPTRFKPARQPEAVAAGFVVGRRHAGGRVARGPWVSAHPDVILKMGVKEVLHRTKHLGWGADTHLYRSAPEFRRAFPERLSTGPRVLKQNRGNGGQGVWKVELVAEAGGTDPLVRVLHAQRGSASVECTVEVWRGDCRSNISVPGSDCVAAASNRPVVKSRRLTRSPRRRNWLSAPPVGHLA